MSKLKTFRKANGLTQTEVAEFLGVGKSFISRIESGAVGLPQDKLSKLIDNSHGWNISMLAEAGSSQIGNGASGVVITGNNFQSPIDNRHYYSDSPDVLRAQIDLLDERLKEKEERLKEKDAQIKEKDAQIKQLLDILQGRK